MPAPKSHKAYPGCEAGGRPVIYTKEFIEYEAEAFQDWLKNPENIYFKKFALERGYHPQRLSEFAEKNEKFSEAYQIAKAWQEIKLVEGGLLSQFHAGFTKFVLGNVCGWVDKHETKVSGDNSNPLAFLLRKIDGNSKNIVS